MTKLDNLRLENKAADGIVVGDINTMMHNFMGAFEEFKSANDARLENLEKRGSSDAILEEKLHRLNLVMDGQKRALDKKHAEYYRPNLEDAQSAHRNEEYKSSFAAYVKRGEEKALSTGVSAEGGYLVPVETEAEISRLLGDISPIRAISGVRQISTSLYKKPVTLNGPQVGWVGETANRPMTTAQTIDELTFPTMELYAMPAATQNFLDDAAVDVGDWIANEVNAAFAEQETNAFIKGDGVNKPKGFLSEAIVAEGNWAWEKLGYVPTGAAGAFAAGAGADALVDLVYALKAGYRQNAKFVLNRKTQAAVRKLKDADGNYLWSPSLSPNGYSTLMGFDVVEAEDMPDIANNSYSIAFGDFKRGYLIVDRQGVNILRDPYSAKPYVLFYTTKRVGGGVADFDAIKLLKFAAS